MAYYTPFINKNDIQVHLSRDRLGIAVAFTKAFCCRIKHYSFCLDTQIFLISNSIAEASCKFDKQLLLHNTINDRKQFKALLNISPSDNWSNCSLDCDLQPFCD